MSGVLLPLSKAFAQVYYEVLYIGYDALGTEAASVGKLVDCELGDVHAVEVYLSDCAVIEHSV